MCQFCYLSVSNVLDVSSVVSVDSVAYNICLVVSEVSVSIPFVLGHAGTNRSLLSHSVSCHLSVFLFLSLS